MRLTDFAVLSFDCYGTLIDWETGILGARGPWLDRAGITVAAEEVLEAFARFEAAREQEHPATPYPQILAGVHRDLAAEWGIDSRPEDAESFGASVGDWPPFADTPGALAYLARYYRLVILSNVDRSSFARSSHRLGITFDGVFTAEDIGSYKLDPRNFEHLIAQLGRLP